MARAGAVSAPVHFSRGQSDAKTKKIQKGLWPTFKLCPLRTSAARDGSPAFEIAQVSGLHGAGVDGNAVKKKTPGA